MADEPFHITAVYKLLEVEVGKYTNDMRKYLSARKLENEHVIIGDININIMDKSTDTLEYLNMMSEFGFFSAIVKVTRENTSGGSCLDHIFIKTKLRLKDIIISFIAKTSVTDHYPVGIIVPIRNHKTVTENRSKVFKQID